MIASDWEYSDLQCPACGRNMREASCWACGGQGKFDLHDYNPLYINPGSFRDCDICSGTGKEVWCPCETSEGVTDA